MGLSLIHRHKPAHAFVLQSTWFGQQYRQQKRSVLRHHFTRIREHARSNCRPPNSKSTEQSIEPQTTKEKKSSAAKQRQVHYQINDEQQFQSKVQCDLGLRLDDRALLRQKANVHNKDDNQPEGKRENTYPKIRTEYETSPVKHQNKSFSSPQQVSNIYSIQSN